MEKDYEFNIAQQQIIIIIKDILYSKIESSQIIDENKKEQLMKIIEITKIKKIMNYSDL